MWARCVADVEVEMMGKRSDTPCEVCESGEWVLLEWVDWAVGEGLVPGDSEDAGGEGPWAEPPEPPVAVVC